MSDDEPPPDPAPDEEKIPLTPGLVVLGILALALGVFAGLVMSAQALGR